MICPRRGGCGAVRGGIGATLVPTAMPGRSAPRIGRRQAVRIGVARRTRQTAAAGAGAVELHFLPAGRLPDRVGQILGHRLNRRGLVDREGLGEGRLELAGADEVRPGFDELVLHRLVAHLGPQPELDAAGLGGFEPNLGLRQLTLGARVRLRRIAGGRHEAQMDTLDAEVRLLGGDVIGLAMLAFAFHRHAHIGMRDVRGAQSARRKLPDILALGQERGDQFDTDAAERVVAFANALPCAKLGIAFGNNGLLFRRRQIVG